MNKTFFSLLLAGALLAPLPLVAQDEDSDVDISAETDGAKPAKGKKKKADKGDKKGDAAKRKASAALKKAETAMKNFEKSEKARAKVKIKWESSDKKAFKEAAKHNLPVWVLYSDPATCPYCVKLDNEIIFSKEFKKATGLFIGYRSTSPLPAYGLSNGKPMGKLYTPDKKELTTLAYTPNQGPDAYIGIIRGQGDKILAEAKKKVESDLEKAKADMEALKEEETESEETAAE